MAPRRAPEKKTIKRRPATTVEDRENQLISLSVDLAEQQILDGTVSSQTLSHFLKMGSTREKLEKERLMRENDLLKAKVDGLASSSKLEALYQDAISAFRGYSGEDEEVYDDD